jgi:hypothetical protein
MGSKNINIKIVEPQSEEKHPCELSQEEIDAYLYKYNNDSNKKVTQDRTQRRSPQAPQKRVNADSDTQKSNREYYDVRYQELDAGNDKVNFKIEVKSDMKL